MLTLQLKKFIVEGLREDIGPGDITSQACIPPDQVYDAYLLVKDHGILAGMNVAKEVFRHLDKKIEFNPLLKDGDEVEYGQKAFKVKGNSQLLLQAERLILNTMQRMSGIATLSREYARAIEEFDTVVLDTRKTTPGIRFLEKEAVEIGGCKNYRAGLYDWVMIKDNHVKACGGVAEAIDRVHAYLEENKLERGITVEVKDLSEAQEVLEKGDITRIMFDNFTTTQLREGVQLIEGKFETEASGGITLKNLKEIARTGVDYISVGALTYGATPLDLSMKFF